MKNSSKFLFVIASSLLVVSSGLQAAETVAGTSVQQNADTPPPPPGEGRRGGGGPGMMMERAKKQLNLTADQEAKWKAIGDQERAAIDALRADTSLSKEEQRAQIMEVNKGFADQRRAALNAEQQVKFDELRAKLAERGGKGGPGGPGGKKKKDN
ncbi:hypothetical protein [Oleiharenicola lentus]|uniref:hypothetical protein n=1 Tax=Oleiharenicola lentus TaxID=2508720 RepID=UPI003F668F2E